MNKKSFLILSLLVPVMALCQSVSKEKLISYGRFQNLKIIEKDLDSKGFITKIDKDMLGAVKTEDSQNVSEVISCQIIQKNNVFSVVYQSPIYFEKFKIELTSNLPFISEENGITFYEGGSYRVGINEANKIVAIYTKLNK